MKNTLNNNEFIFLCNQITEFSKDNSELNLLDAKSFEEKRMMRGKVQRLIGEENASNKPNTSAQHPEMDEDIV